MLKIARELEEKIVKEPYKNIIVRMPNWIGDIVMATPVLKAIKDALPSAKLTAMCKHPASDLLKDNPYIDSLFSFKEAKPIFFRRDEASSITDHIKNQHYDLGVLLTNSLSSAWYFWQGDVKHRIGFRKFPRTLLLQKSLDKPPKSVHIHQVDEYLSLLKLININPRQIAPKLYLHPDEITQAKELLKLYDINASHQIIGINPGATYGSAKCWMPERFHELASVLIKKHPNARLVFFGDASQTELIKSICTNLPKEVINLSAQTSLRELMALTACCKVFLSNDSGPMHIASGLGIPVVALFGSTSDIRTGPYQGGLVIHKHVSCAPCYLRKCPIDFRCMKSIEVSEVLHQIESQLHL
jgi:heptosyltransferase-2